MRDLTITKMGDNGKYVPGVTFEIYGPFDNTFVVSEDNKVDTITTNENGIAKFESEGPDKYLNAYAHYVVVERLPEDSHYSTETFTVAAGEGTTLKETTVSFDDAVEKAPCFILAPYAGENANGKVQDSVTVTNKYVTTGSLSITGSKSVIGDTDLEGYTFKLTSRFRERQGADRHERRRWHLHIPAHGGDAHIRLLRCEEHGERPLRLYAHRGRPRREQRHRIR